MLLIPTGRFPPPELLKLARKHGIDAPDNIKPKALSEAMQQGWRRTTTHQFQIQGTPPDDEDFELLRTLGFVEQAEPKPGYQAIGIIVYGATLPAVRKRLGFLADCTNFSGPVFLLSSARPLDSEKESATNLCTPGELPFRPDWQPPGWLPTSESDMVHLVVTQSQFPTGWQPRVVASPLERANTRDTLQEWFKTEPPSGHYLVVSSQPYVVRQTLDAHIVCAAENKEGFSFRGIGYAASRQLALKKFLDAVAAQLQTEIEAWQ